MPYSPRTRTLSIAPCLGPTRARRHDAHEIPEVSVLFLARIA